MVGTRYPCHTWSWRRPKKKIKKEKWWCINEIIFYYYCWISCLTCLNLPDTHYPCIFRLLLDDRVHHTSIHIFMKEFEIWLIRCVYANIHFPPLFVGPIRSGFLSHFICLQNCRIQFGRFEMRRGVNIPFEYYNITFMNISEKRFDSNICFYRMRIFDFWFISL